MKKPIIMAVVLGSMLGLGSVANADDSVVENKNSALPVSDHQISNMGQLRGIIDQAADNSIIEAQHSQTARSISEIEKTIREAQEVALSLDTPEPLIDKVVTGQSNRLMLYQKFDSKGLPMNHHQEYARPNAKSLASSIWDAIDMNPYPGE